MRKTNGTSLKVWIVLSVCSITTACEGTRRTREDIEGKDSTVFAPACRITYNILPKEETDPDFAAALKKAKEKGVIIKVFKNKIRVDGENNLLIEPLEKVGINF